MDKQKISFDMGLRLKDLREARGLSYQGLADALFNNYGVKISKDSLRDYEISSDYRSKAKSLPNLGMRTEYLYVLADFYGVSTDYLLGFSPIPSLDVDIQQVCKYIGLNQQAVEQLHKISQLSDIPNMPILFLNTFLDKKGILEFSNFAWRAAISEVIYERRIRKSLSVDDFYALDETERNECMEEIRKNRLDAEKEINKRLLMQLNGELQTNELMGVATAEASMLYTSRALSWLEDALDDAISCVTDSFYEGELIYAEKE